MRWQYRFYGWSARHFVLFMASLLVAPMIAAWWIRDSFAIPVVGSYVNREVFALEAAQLLGCAAAVGAATSSLRDWEHRHTPAVRRLYVVVLATVGLWSVTFPWIAYAAAELMGTFTPRVAEQVAAGRIDGLFTTSAMLRFSAFGALTSGLLLMTAARFGRIAAVTLVPMVLMLGMAMQSNDRYAHIVPIPLGAELNTFPAAAAVVSLIAGILTWYRSSVKPIWGPFPP